MVSSIDHEVSIQKPSFSRGSPPARALTDFGMRAVLTGSVGEGRICKRSGGLAGQQGLLVEVSEAQLVNDLPSRMRMREVLDADQALHVFQLQ